MHEKVSDITILTIIVSTVLLVMLGGIIIYFLFAYQKKSYRHQKELLMLNENFHKTLLLSRLEITEETLDRIAKELHANISPLISVININLSAYIQRHPTEQNENLLEAKTLVKQLLAEVKSLSLSLNTEHIGKAGFVKMLTHELIRLKRTGVYQINYESPEQFSRMAADREIILFRLCQEILDNIIKHAYADTITVVLGYTPNILTVTIEDNGTGFDLQLIQAQSGTSCSSGLNNIYSRSKQIGATVDIYSEQKQGTRITVTIPI